MKTRNASDEDTYRGIVTEAISAIGIRKPDKADSYLRIALALDYSRPEAFNILGILMEMKGDRLQAQNYYRAAISLDPSYEPAIDNLDRCVGLKSKGSWNMGRA